MGCVIQLAHDIAEFTHCGHTALIIISARCDNALVRLVALNVVAVFPANITLNPQACNKTEQGDRTFEIGSQDLNTNFKAVRSTPARPSTDNHRR